MVEQPREIIKKWHLKISILNMAIICFAIILTCQQIVSYFNYVGVKNNTEIMKAVLIEVKELEKQQSEDISDLKLYVSKEIGEHGKQAQTSLESLIRLGDIKRNTETVALNTKYLEQVIKSEDLNRVQFNEILAEVKNLGFYHTTCMKCHPREHEKSMGEIPWKTK